MAGQTSRMLNDESLAELRALGRRQSFSAGDTLFFEGDRSTSVYWIETGLLKLTKVSLDGRHSLLGLRAAGSLIGEFAALDNLARSATATALSPTVAFVLTAAQFEELMHRRPDVTRVLLAQLTRKLRESSARMLEYATADAASRVANRLTSLVPDDDLRVLALPRTDIHIRLPISQAELAEWSGLSRESIVKALRELRDDGLIETARKQVTIRDFERLHQIGLAAYAPDSGNV